MKNLNKIDDAELISKYLDGDEAAFEQLYDRYKRQLYSYLHKILSSNTSLCDEIFQQTWIRAIDNLSKYRDKERFLAWIMRISHNLAMDHFRRNSQQDSDDIVELDKQGIFQSPENPFKELSIKEARKRLEECVSKLPPEQKEVFLLRTDDLTFREIASIQNCSINTVLARMQYALKSLRNCLKNRRTEK